jgi:hypothetical protein
MFEPRRLSRATFVLAVIVGGVSVGRADEVTFWNSLALDILKENSTSPPKAARDLAMVHSSVYDAVNAIERTHAPLYYQAPAVGSVSREAAVAAAAYESLVGLYPTCKTTLTDTYNTRLTGIADGAARNAGVALGLAVADNMLTLRVSDGSAADSVHRGGTAPGQWRPTPPTYQSGLTPLWGNVTPFAIPDVADYRPDPPPALSSAEYAASLNEVKSLGASNSTTRTADQTQIAEFWNDFPGTTATPAGKWNLIAQTLGAQQGNTLAENARMLALLNVALADAGIVCWDAKYTYEIWRPEDAIHLADTDCNPGTLVDPDWTPQWPSPSFPEYTSGHSTYRGAGAEVLSLFFGTDDIAFDAEAGFDVLAGVTRHYDGISQAALEAGYSRIYGGIHFQFSNVAGMESGQAVGDYVYSHFAQAVPEPGTASLIILGMACLLRGRRGLRIDGKRRAG